MSEGGYREWFPRVYLRKDKTNPRRIAYLLLLLFATPPGWPLMSVGSVLVLAGIAFHGWAAGYLARAGYEDRETVLTLLGPYRHNRNPYYVAHMVMDLGFFCVAGLAPFYLLYFPLIFAVYRRWVLNEEPFLRREFGAEYEEMCSEVPRWGVRLRPAAPRGPDQRFTWSMYAFNGEHWRSGSHLLWLGVFWLFWGFGNPLAALPPLVPATVAAVVITHYLVHDITPRDVSRLAIGWLALALAVALGGGILLTNAPVWAVWPAPWTWLGLGGGGALAALIGIAALRPGARSRADGRRGLFGVAMTPLYLAALAVGLMSCTLGGVWLAVTVSLVLWALSIAGVIRLRAPSRSAVSGAVMLVAPVVAGSAPFPLIW